MPKKVSGGDFPLYKHASGQWAKKILGKVRYFGRDRQEAAKRWLKEKDFLLAGEEPPGESDAATVSELANVFYEKQRLRVTHEKNVTARHIENLAGSIERMIRIVGKGCHLEKLKPLDWDEIRLRLFEPAKGRKGARGGTITRKKISQRSPITVSNDVRNILVFLNWIQEKKLTAPLDLSSDFRPIGRKEARINRRKVGRRDLSAADIHSIINAAHPGFAPLVWLGINCAAGAEDLAHVEFEHLKLSKSDSWFDMERMKTGASRKAWLWPETVAAIENWLQRRPPYPPRKADDNVVFLTAQRMRWVRDYDGRHYDSISHTFTKLRKGLKIERGVFYDLRRTFATVACERSRDIQAIKYVMGHVTDKNDLLADVYNQSICDERIREVCQHVRSWMLEGAK